LSGELRDTKGRVLIKQWSENSIWWEQQHRYENHNHRPSRSVSPFLWALRPHTAHTYSGDCSSACGCFGFGKILLLPILDTSSVTLNI